MSPDGIFVCVTKSTYAAQDIFIFRKNPSDNGYTNLNIGANLAGDYEDCHMSNTIAVFGSFGGVGQTV